ncbi:mucin-5AC-like [Pomacea canaliculata]|uniref:mucin-5AC-like n=1 Tax=Pomacea canaliculata TaxID=400727 RepID=UPI000D72BC3B|nr:mucin-5AC-like [Pomacea canaliculata]
MGTDYFLHHVLVYLGAKENISQVPLLLDVGTVCCDVANFSKDCYVTYQPTGRNNSETNEAVFKSTTQISTARSGPASLAVDNNTDGSYTHGSCSHTSETTNTQFWWQVDLALALPVAKLRIYNRVDCCAFRLKNIDVLVGRRSSSSIAYTRCVQHDDVFPAVQTLVCGQPLCGQYVRVVKAPVSALEALTLCEVQVYTGTFDPGKPTTNEPSVQTSSTSPTTPENASTPDDSVVNAAGSTQTQNTRETTPDDTSEDSSLSPLVDITFSGVAWGDAGGQTSTAPFPLALDTISTVKSPQSSVNDSSTQPSAENSSTTTETGDDPRLTRAVLSGRDTAAETTPLTSRSDNEALHFSSGVEFTEVTRSTATSTLVSVKATSGDTVMPAPMSVMDVTPPESPTDGMTTTTTTTTTMADLVSAVSLAEFADQTTATVSTTTSVFHSTATTTGNEGSLTNIEMSAAMSGVRVSVSVMVADQQRSESATNLVDVTSVSKLPSDMADMTDLYTLTPTVAPRPEVSVTCHEGSSCLKSVTRESEPTVTSGDHFVTAPVPTVTPPEYLVTKSLSNMELVTSDTILTVSPVTLEHFVTDPVMTNNIPVISLEHFVTESVSDHELVTRNSVLSADGVTNLEPVVTESVLGVSPVTSNELLKLDSVTNAIPVSKMYTESQPIASELTNLSVVTNYGATATTTATTTTATTTTATTTTVQVNVITSMPEETMETSQSSPQLLAVITTSTSSSPTTAQDFPSPVSTLSRDFESTPIDFLVTVVVLSSDVLATHFDSLTQGLHHPPHSSILTSPYVSEATNSGGDAVVDIIVSTVQQGFDVVSSNDDYSYPSSATMVDFSHVTSTTVLPSSAEAKETNVERSVDSFSEPVNTPPRSFVSTTEGLNYVTSPAMADATKVTLSDHGENTVRDVVNSKDMLSSTIPSASRVVDSNSSASHNSTDLSSLAISNVSSSLQPVTHTSGIPSVSVTRSEENDRTLFVSDLSLAVSQTTHVTGNVDKISLLPLPSASQVPHLRSSSEEYSQLSLSNQTAQLLDTITKLIPVLVESDKSRVSLVEVNTMPTSSIFPTIIVNNMPTTTTLSSGGGNNHPLLYTSTVVTGEHVTTADVSDAVEATRMDSSLDTHYPLLHPASVTYFPETSADPSHDPDSGQALRQTPTLDQASLSTMSNKTESPSSKEHQVTAGSITTTTRRPPSTTPPRSPMCPCGCQRKLLQPNTSQDANYLDQLRQTIEDELKMSHADLAQQVMKKTSAPDGRHSAVAVGAVAVIIMILSLLILVLLDLIDLLRWLHMHVVRRTRVEKLHLPT